jgi:hormone-sensitive lipase
VPSNIRSLDDKMIPMGLLMLCRESYLKNQSNVPTDFYASPIYLPSEII